CFRHGGQRGTETPVERRRMDAPGEVAQLNEGFLGVAVRRGDQHAHPGSVVRAARCFLPRAAVGVTRRVEAFLDLAEGHGERGEPDLRAVVQVALDPAQPGGGLVDHAGAPLLQLAGALRGPRDPRLRVPFGFEPGGAPGGGEASARGGGGAHNATTPRGRGPPRRARPAAAKTAPRECAVGAGPRRPPAAAAPTRQITRPAMETRRDRCAASVYSST